MDTERRRKYKENLDLYNGVHWPGSARRGEKRLTFNYVKVAIDKMTSYLTQDMSIAVDPLDDTEATADKASEAEVELSRVIASLSLNSLIYATEVDCAILGDGCYKVLWDTARKQVKVTAPDVQGVFVWTAPDDNTDVIQVACQYELPAATPRGKKPTRTEVWTPARFDLWDNAQLVSSKKNPYGFIPFIIFPNISRPKEYWGESDVVSLKEPQIELNRAVSQLSHILELSGNPIAVLENISEAEDIAVKPGAVWAVPEDAKAYLLDLLQGGGVRLHIDYIDLLYKAFHDLSETPKTAWAKDERDLSGVALEIEMQPLLQRMRRKRLIRDRVYRTLFDYILKLLTQYQNYDAGNVVPRVVWGASLPRDRSREIDNECRLIEKMVHTRKRAMEILGVEDPGKELADALRERADILEQTANKGKTPGAVESV